MVHELLLSRDAARTQYALQVRFAGGALAACQDEMCMSNPQLHNGKD
jgi:hypothetical protein